MPDSVRLDFVADNRPANGPKIPELPEIQNQQLAARFRAFPQNRASVSGTSGDPGLACWWQFSDRQGLIVV
jgi:hypothetical protein